MKTPKVYIRDSGLLHALVGIEDFDDLSSHPIIGASWEGFVIEQILQRMPYRTEATFYRSSAGAEIDLLLESPGSGTYAIEIKRTLEPKLSKGFRFACEDIQPEHRFYVLPIEDSFPMDDDTQAVSIETLLSGLRD